MIKNNYVSADGSEFLQRIDTYLPTEEYAQVERAFNYARLMHGAVRRRSGEFFYQHPLTVAYYLAEYRLDVETLCAALLHDVVEDVEEVQIEDIEALFGGTVAYLVSGVTKVEELPETGRILSSKEKSAYTLQNLFQSITKNNDVRVALIKLSDRLHNMRTIANNSERSKIRNARETLRVFAPLAKRLGMWQLKSEFEDISFSLLQPEIHADLTEILRQRKQALQPLLAKVECSLKQRFDSAEIDPLLIRHSPLRAYTIYQQNLTENKPPLEVDDLVRLVIVLKDQTSCYAALGVIHNLWPPIHGTFDDYIARPRENLYRALHTTVRHHSGQTIKIRLRSQAMSLTSNLGVLSQWADLSKADLDTDIRQEVARQINTLINTIDDTITLDTDNGQLTGLDDALGNQIAVFTPKGHTVELPEGSTPIDFAYKIHTELGNSCHTALVNGIRVALNTPLADGAEVEVQRVDNAAQRLWLHPDLGYIKIAKNKDALRRHFRRRTVEQAISEGRRELCAELNMISLPNYSHQTIATWYGHKNSEDLYRAIGVAEVLVTQISARALIDYWEAGHIRTRGCAVESNNGDRWIILDASHFRDLKLCRNCNPKLGERILGNIRKDNRVTVHREDCHLLTDTDFSDLLKLTWGAGQVEEVRQFVVQIDVHDRTSLLLEIAQLMHDENVNISWIMTPNRGKDLSVVLCVEVNDSNQLVRILHQLRAMVNVQYVCCRPESPGDNNTETFVFSD